MAKKMWNKSFNLSFLHPTSEEEAERILSFRDTRGCTRIDHIGDKYEILEIIAQGTFGAVRLARHKAANVHCAIKFIRKNDLRGDKVLKNLMKQELHVLEDTFHPNIVRVYELCHDDVYYYIVCELMAHGNLLSLTMERIK